MVDFVKRILFIFIVYFMCSVVYAEQFKIGDYISGEYVKMVGKNTSKYLTIQFIRDSNNSFVYCIEPFLLVDENETNYITYESDLSGYKDLTEEQKRKVSLIAYYGYGYKDRMTKKWYAVTQLLIWRVVDPDSEFYFTDTSNGEKISKYGGEMNDILSDVYDHDLKPSFIKDYEINYGEDLVINKFNIDYDIVTDKSYTMNGNNLVFSQIEDDSSFVFERKKDRTRNVTIYDGPNSQDLLRAGNVIDNKYTINVKVNSGDITLDIRKDDSTIYNNSNFSNTCYEISRGEDIIDNVCTSDDNLIYKTNKLGYGEYSIKQVSPGVGYEVDNNVHNVIVDGSEQLILENKLIKNKIELTKYYCINEDCLYEENAIFNIYNNDLLVGSITTNSEGYGYIEVGIGEYTIIQEYGLDNYTFVDEYSESIVDSTSSHYKDLYNYYIEEDTGFFDTVVPEEVVDDNINNDIEDSNQEIIMPPQTGSKLAELLKIVYNVIMVVICSCNLRRFCYNN